MTSRENSELRKEVEDLKKRVAALERALASQQARRSSPSTTPGRTTYRPETRTLQQLEARLALFGDEWDDLYMGMSKSKFLSLLKDSANFESFLYAVLRTLLGASNMHKFTLGRPSGRCEAMDHDTRDQLYRLVATYLSKRPQEVEVTFASVNSKMSHMLGNLKRRRRDESDDDDDDDSTSGVQQQRPLRIDTTTQHTDGSDDSEGSSVPDGNDEGAGPSGINRGGLFGGQSD